MQVGELPAYAFPAVCTLLGAAGGVLGGWLADVLPPRYDIKPLTTGGKRARRNHILVVLSALCGLGLGLLIIEHPDSHLGLAAFYVAVNLLLVVGLLASAAVDLEHMILPNEITLGGAVLALATARWRSVGLRGAILGAGIGFLVAYLPSILYRLIRKRGGQGFGDTKLLFMVGAWLGLEGALFVLFAAALQSVLVAVVMRVLGISYQVPESVLADIAEVKRLAESGDAEAKAALAEDPMAGEPGEGMLAARLPLGPFLALGCLEMLYARRPILDAFARYLSPG